MTRPLRYYVIWEDGRATHIVAGYAAAYKLKSFKGFPSRTIAMDYAARWNREAAAKYPHRFSGKIPPVEVIEPDTPERFGAQYVFSF